VAKPIAAGSGEHFGHGSGFLSKRTGGSMKFNKMMKTKLYPVLGMALGVLLVGSLVPVAANAQVVVHHIVVVESSSKIGASGTVVAGATSYCDTAYKTANPTLCDLGVWNIPSPAGIPLAAGETLVLTQTGTFSNTADNTDPNNDCTKTPCIEPNFDTSEEVSPGKPVGANCSTTLSNPCTVTIKLDTGAGLVTVYGPNSAGIALNNGNNDNTGNTAEGADYDATLGSGTGFTLTDGYADNEHSGSKFPTPFNGATNPAGKKNTFIGAAVAGNQNGCNNNCYDGGVILITGVAVSTPCSSNCVTVTQGGWGTAPHGHNPGSILAANFSSVFPAGVAIGCGAGVTYTFDSAVGVRNFLPQGGPPAVLPPPSLLDPTAKFDVFAGQVLALSINVAFSGPVFPGGLGAFIPFNSGPLSGLTVSQILNIADNVLGGCTPPPNGMTVSSLNDAVDFINNLFD
jgi:hypothetical protein